MNLLFASLRGSPGVTTLAVLLAHFWPRDCILIEADSAGGNIAARFGLKANSPGLLNLVTGCRRNLDAETIRHSCQHLPGGAPVVVATGRNSTIQSLLGEISLRDMNQVMAGTDFFVDLGRTESSLCPPNLLVDADALVLLVHPKFEQLNSLLSQLLEFTQQVSVGVVLVNDKDNAEDEYSKSEIDAALQSISAHKARVLGSIVYDRKGAELCNKKGPAFRQVKKSLLARSLTGLMPSLMQIARVEAPSHKAVAGEVRV